MRLRVEVVGPIDPTTGYLCNIKLLDTLLRDAVAATVNNPSGDAQSDPWTAESLLARVSQQCDSRWNHPAQIIGLELDLSEFLTYRLVTGAPAMISMTEQFEFSAAHRLHCDQLTDEENQQVFGKCNHPNGHGHNYVVEVTVSRDQPDAGQPVIDLPTFEATVNRLVIDRLDHKHLNLDEPHFANLNPTVENIAAAIHGWLDGQFGDANLARVRVYETPKTWAEFPAGL